MKSLFVIFALLSIVGAVPGVVWTFNLNFNSAGNGVGPATFDGSSWSGASVTMGAFTFNIVFSFTGTSLVLKSSTAPLFSLTINFSPSLNSDGTGCGITVTSAEFRYNNFILDTLNTGTMTPSQVAPGCGTADPSFIGFHGQKYKFNGYAGGIFNIYSDPHVIINSEFGRATIRKGTVMSSIGIMAGGHSISFGVSSFANGSLSLVVDEATVRLDSVSNSLALAGCIDLNWNPSADVTNQLLLTTPLHAIHIYIDHRHSRHISHDYLDILISRAEDVTNVGGVIGQTADADAHISKADADFEVSGLFGVDAPSTKSFSNQSFDCSQQTQRSMVGAARVAN